MPRNEAPTIRGLSGKGCCSDATVAGKWAASSGFFCTRDQPAKMGNAHTFQKARYAVLRLTGWQLMLTAVLSSLAWWAGSGAAALAVATGGIIGVVAGLYQSMRLLQVDASLSPAAFAQSVWTSEAVKILVTVALFLLAIKLLAVQMVPTIVGYAATYIVYWVALATRYPWFEPDVDASDKRTTNWPD